MKKFTLIAALFILPIKGFSQEKIKVEVAGMTIEAVDWKKDWEENGQSYEKWLIYEEEDIYVMSFKRTPVGYKHCLDRVKDILEINNLSFDNDRSIESILIPDHCDGIFDYHCLPDQFYLGNAEVMIGWETKNGDRIVIDCNDEAISLGLRKVSQATEGKGRQERESKKNQLDELMGGLNNTEGVEADAEGDDQGVGDKGKPDGDPYANTYYGSPGSGSGTGGYGLSGRSLQSSNPVRQQCNEEGRVVVRIVVDRNGRVIEAQAGVKGSTNTDPCLLEPARRTALSYKWNPDSKAPNQQIGFVVVNFKIGN